MEIWLPIKGFENYEASNDGRISDALKGKINSVNGYHFEKN